MHIFVGIYLCAYVHVHIYTYIFVYEVYTFMYRHTCPHIYAYIYTCMYAYTHTYKDTHICAYIHCVHTHTCTYLYVCASTRVCLCTCGCPHAHSSALGASQICTRSLHFACRRDILAEVLSERGRIGRLCSERSLPRTDIFSFFTTRVKTLWLRDFSAALLEAEEPHASVCLRCACNRYSCEHGRSTAASVPHTSVPPDNSCRGEGPSAGKMSPCRDTQSSVNKSSIFYINLPLQPALWNQPACFST